MGGKPGIPGKPFRIQTLNRHIMPIDLRSDTVTKPTPEMKERMFSAEVGDDVYGEDPTVNRLEEMIAVMLGKERGLFVPTGVMGNQLCLKALTEPGDEVIVGKNSHIFNYESGAPGVLSGIQLCTVGEEEGKLREEEILRDIRESAYYLPRTAVIAQEQTHNKEGGKTIPAGHLTRIAEIGKENGAAAHLDGARLWNAVAETGISPVEWAAPFDTVSVCFSKGLGAPVGSALVGPAAVVERAHRFRKMWGGGWRQGGILAAACIYALENNIDRLREDHKKARAFYERIAAAPGIDLGTTPDTNIVLFRVPGLTTGQIAEAAQSRGVLISTAFKGMLRAVFHMDVSMEESIAAADTLVEEIGRLIEEKEGKNSATDPA